MDLNTNGRLTLEQREELEESGRAQRDNCPVACPGPPRVRTEASVSARSETARLVEARARQRYEYCRMHQSFQGAINTSLN